MAKAAAVKDEAPKVAVATGATLKCVTAKAAAATEIGIVAIVHADRVTAAANAKHVRRALKKLPHRAMSQTLRRRSSRHRRLTSYRTLVRHREQ